MIDKVRVLNIVEEGLKNSEDKFLVTLKITPDNRIFVDMDGDNGVTIDDCIALSRWIESQLNREEEDYELNVASAGVDSPLRMPRQYRKNVGREVSVTTLDGEKLEGRLEEADEKGFTIVPASGRKKVQPQPVKFAYEEVKATKVMVKF